MRINDDIYEAFVVSFQRCVHSWRLLLFERSDKAGRRSIMMTG